MICKNFYFVECENDIILIFLKEIMYLLYFSGSTFLKEIILKYIWVLDLLQDTPETKKAS